MALTPELTDAQALAIKTEELQRIRKALTAFHEHAASKPGLSYSADWVRDTTRHILDGTSS